MLDSRDVRVFPILLALGVSIAASCVRSTSAVPTEVILGQSLQLRIGESARVKGTSVVVRVAGANDSRCPSDAVCVWAGDAAVALDVSGADGVGNRTDTLYLRRQPTGVTYGLYRIDLVDVQPYPVSTKPDAARVVTLRLSRAE